MENDLKKLFFTIFVALTVLLGGCDVKTKLEQQSSEIDRLNSLINQQYGTRSANLDFAERQVAVYQGCTFLFNVCSSATLANGKIYLKNGFSGSSSTWWWVAFIGKLTGIAAFIGTLIWLPWHLFVLFTRPAKVEIDEAKNLIAGLDAKVKDANRRRTQTQQETSAMKREFERISAAAKVMEQAGVTANAKLEAAQRELAEINRLKENFRRF